MRVGGLQTLGLALVGENGRSYTFRSVDKGALLVLPDGFRDTGLEYVIQDQVSSSMPAADLIVTGLARAGGVLSVDQRLVVMPDDPRLGEFREAFAGVLGMFYEFPTDGSLGSTEVFDSEDFLERRLAGADFGDAEAFLRARLLDLLIGDWDRHYGQWRWARMPGEEGLQPIPEDRDQAFSHYDGLALAIARTGGGQMTAFEGEYPAIGYLARNGSDFDRLMLAGIEREVWLEIAVDLQESIDDAAISDAVARLPAPYFALQGEHLEAVLRARRDGLVEYAAEYYEFLAGEVDIHGTDRDETIAIEHFNDGDVEVSISIVGAGTARPYYRRRFDAGETREFRLYLGAGDDRVTVEGVGEQRITMRVIGGQEASPIDGPGRGFVKYYRSPGNYRYVAALSVEESKRAFSPMIEANWEIAVPGMPYRDWGHDVQPLFVGRWHQDLGLALGGGLDLKQFGFGKAPWAARHRLSGAYAIGSNNAALNYAGDFRRIGGGPHFEVIASGSGFEQLRYYGLGNETGRDGPGERFEIAQKTVEAGGFLAWGELQNPAFRVGAVAEYVDSRGTDPGTVLASEAPYGFDAFGQLGVRAGFRYDSRRDLPTLSSGVDVDASATYHPELWDVETHYGVLEGSAAAHVQIARPVTISFLFGGKKNWGDYPYFAAAYLGGEDTFTAYNWNRFAGDAMARGGARLRWALTRLNITVPGDVGLALRADAGRVFRVGEDSDLWHSQLMAGVFYAAFDRLLLVEIGVGWSEEHTVVTFDADFDWLIR
jgi:hypothetical protein